MESTKKANRETTQINTSRTEVALPGFAGAIGAFNFMPMYANAAATTTSATVSRMASAPV